MSVSITNKSPRQSNFELLRIVSMMLVLILHANFFSLGVPDHLTLTEHPTSTCVRMIIQSMAVVCVNVFVLISGYFSIRSNKKSVLNLLFIIVFWRVLILCFYLMLNWERGDAPDPTFSELILMLIPGEGDWFVQAYILLLFIAPMANAYIEKSNNRQLLFFLSLYFGLQFCLNWIMNVYKPFNNGYSVLSLLGLYIAGAFIRKNNNKFTIKANVYTFFSGYIICSIGFAIIAFYILYRYSLPQLLYGKIMQMFETYNNIVSVTSSILLFLAFMCMSFSSKFINAVAASAFSVYIVHMHPLLRRPFMDVCRYLYNNFDTIEYIGLISVFLISIYVLITIVDRLRIYLWRVISARFIV